MASPPLQGEGQGGDGQRSWSFAGQWVPKLELGNQKMMAHRQKANPPCPPFFKGGDAGVTLSEGTLESSTLSGEQGGDGGHKKASSLSGLAFLIVPIDCVVQ